MAQGFGNIRTGVLDGSSVPASKADGMADGARVRCYREIFDLSKANVAKNVGDTLLVCRRPRSTRFRAVSVTTSVTLGAATLAIGNATAPAKYGAATTYTTPDTPVGSGKAAARAEDPLTDFEDVILTIGAAALPNGGLIVVDFETLAR